MQRDQRKSSLAVPHQFFVFAPRCDKVANVPKSVPIGHENGPRRSLRGPFHLVALSQFCSNTLFTDVQDASVTDRRPRVPSPVPQRRRITAGLRAEVIEHYNRGMSSRRVAATLGLGRTTLLEILKAAGVDIRPRGRKY
jgi:hypothetical protein